MTSTSPSEILNALRTRGCRLAVRDGQLLVSRQRLLPPDLLAAIRQHRQAIMDLLEGEQFKLPSDCAPWLHIAAQILAGEFDDCDRSTRESLTIGLRSILHPNCQQALVRLRAAPRNTATP